MTPFTHILRLEKCGSQVMQRDLNVTQKSQGVCCGTGMLRGDVKKSAFVVCHHVRYAISLVRDRPEASAGRQHGTFSERLDCEFCLALRDLGGRQLERHGKSVFEKFRWLSSPCMRHIERKQVSVDSATT